MDIQTQCHTDNFVIKIYYMYVTPYIYTDMFIQLYGIAILLTLLFNNAM